MRQWFSGLERLRAERRVGRSVLRAGAGATPAEVAACGAPPPRRRRRRHVPAGSASAAHAAFCAASSSAFCRFEATSACAVARAAARPPFSQWVRQLLQMPGMECCGASGHVLRAAASATPPSRRRGISAAPRRRDALVVGIEDEEPQVRRHRRCLGGAAVFRWRVAGRLSRQLVVLAQRRTALPHRRHGSGRVECQRAPRPVAGCGRRGATRLRGRPGPRRGRYRRSRRSQSAHSAAPRTWTAPTAVARSEV